MATKILSEKNKNYASRSDRKKKVNMNIRQHIRTMKMV